MKKGKVNAWAIIGCLIGVLAIIMGIVIMGSETEVSRDKGGIAFGADFYTEMHRVTRNTFISTLRINEAICSGFGGLLIITGLFGICHYAQKIYVKRDVAIPSDLPTSELE